MKKHCCEKFARKGKNCKKCPLFAALKKKERKKLLKNPQFPALQPTVAVYTTK